MRLCACVWHGLQNQPEQIHPIRPAFLSKSQSTCLYPRHWKALQPEPGNLTSLPVHQNTAACLKELSFKVRRCWYRRSKKIQTLSRKCNFPPPAKFAYSQNRARERFIFLLRSATNRRRHKCKNLQPLSFKVISPNMQLCNVAGLVKLPLWILVHPSWRPPIKSVFNCLDTPAVKVESCHSCGCFIGTGWCFIPVFTFALAQFLNMKDIFFKTYIQISEHFVYCSQQIRTSQPCKKIALFWC